MKLRAVAAGLGAVFGFALSWGQFHNPDRIRDMLLLEDLYLYGMMGLAVGIAFVGTRLLQRARVNALVTGKPITPEVRRPERRHFAGAAIFGLGWAIADSCPAPVAGQLSQGVAWALFTLAGMFVGIALFLRWRAGPAPRLSRRRAPRASRAARAAASVRSS